jgi:porin
MKRVPRVVCVLAAACALSGSGALAQAPPSMTRDFAPAAAASTPGSPATAVNAAAPSAPGNDEAAASPSEWFGGSRHWSEWTRATGDWARARSALERAGVTIALGMTSDWSDVRSTAGQRATLGRGLFDLNASVDLEKLAGVKGGTFYAQYFGNMGADGLATSGAWQALSNIDAARFREFGEVWYQQVFGSSLRIKAGMVDANTEFDHVESAVDFINASMGYSPTIFLLPTYPNPVPSANVFFTPTSHVSFGVGVYRATPDARLSLADGTPASRPFGIAELGVRWRTGGRGLRGRVAGGAWGLSGGISRLDGGRAESTVSPYLLVEHDLWRRDPGPDEDPRSLSVFLQLGSADPSLSEAVGHVGVGLRWGGPFRGRPDDILGIGASLVDFSHAEGASRVGREVSVGPFYLVQLTPWLGVKPDFQVAFHSGGPEARRPAVVGTLRFRMAF